MEPRPDHPTAAPGPQSDDLALRAGDQDRQKVADRLKTAVDEGRLTLDEYDERLGAAYAARTYGELAVLTVDLPAPPQAPSRVEPFGATGTPDPATDAAGPPRSPGARSPHGAAIRYGPSPYGRWSPWRPWLAASLITTVIWLLTGLDEDGFGYFWPMWVIVPWGLVLVSQTVGGGRRHRRSC